MKENGATSNKDFERWSQSWNLKKLCVLFLFFLLKLVYNTQQFNFKKSMQSSKLIACSYFVHVQNVNIRSFKYLQRVSEFCQKGPRSSNRHYTLILTKGGCLLLKYLCPTQLRRGCHVFKFCNVCSLLHFDQTCEEILM